VHTAGVELDDAVRVRQAAETDAGVVGIELDDRDAVASRTSRPSVINRNARSTHVSFPPFLNWCPFADAMTIGFIS
jgi:hypothetical protein